MTADDGNRYSFAYSDVQHRAQVSRGTSVDFVGAEGVATQVFVIGQSGSQSGLAASAASVVGSGSSFDWQTLFLKAGGRIGQRDYWIGVVILFVAGLVLGWLPVIGMLLSLATIYSGVCVASKRHHDLGRSGWLAAIPYGVTAIALVFSGMAVFGGLIGVYGSDYATLAGMGVAVVVWTLAVLLNIGFAIWLGVAAGNSGDNAYGPPPARLANF